jgi:GDP-4-dehydro-6-deoxy-D-mannose reductase
MTAWLVTGGSGFLGRHVLDAIASGGVEPVALGRKAPPGWPSGRFVRGDLDDPLDLACALGSVRPDVVIHAAGRTPPALAQDLFRANVGGLARLIEALRHLGRPARLVVAGSAAELGPVPADRLPADESCPCRPADPYGLSKWAATRLALAAGGPLEVVVGRIFNPIGPGLPSTQAFGRFASLLAAPGPDPLRLRVGDLDARRDFVDVRDAASALVALGSRGRAGSIYHVGTGHSRSVGEGLEALVRLSGRRVVVESSGPGRGPSDSRADASRLAADAGWRPRFDFGRSLADLWAAASAGARAGRVA